MVQSTRGLTRGNRNVDIAAVRQDLGRVNPVVGSTLRNAVPRNGQAPEADELQDKQTINQFKLERLSNIISNNINAATDLRAITPYIDKADLIWRTIMLYPNGKQDKILTYDTQPSPRKNAKLHEELLAIWDNYYTNDYKIEGELKKIISDILFNTGSYTLFNLSRPGLDYLINGSELAGVQGNESFTTAARGYFDNEFRTDPKNGKVFVKNKGRFIQDPNGKQNTIQEIAGLEQLLGRKAPSAAGTDEFRLFDGDEKDIDITITDNAAPLYLQKIREANRRSDVSVVTGSENLSLLIQSALKTRNTPGTVDDGESYRATVTSGDGKKKPTKPAEPGATTQNLTEQQLEELSNRVYPTRNINSQSIQFIKPNDVLKVAPYGRGLVWHVPSEAVIPIHLNGSNGKEIDFIFLTDPSDGSFLKNTGDVEFYQSKKSTSGSIANKPKNGSSNSLISNLRQVQEGKECDFDMSEFAEMAKANIVRRFMQSIISGRGDNISINIDSETNKIFLQRMFRRQGIRCLYVPGEAVTYMALNYNRLGIGQSLTQLAKMHIARLAAFDLADAMSNLEAATPHTQMTINLDEKNPEPFAEIATARAVFFEANPRLHSILSTAQLSVPQIVDALRESSLTVKVNAGDNPHFPSSDISLDHLDKNNFKPVDDSSRQELLNKIANYLHLSKSWLDVSDDQNNFQIEALAEHQMLLNQVVNWQEELGSFLADFQRKHAAVNAPLLAKLVAKIHENKKLWAPDSKEEMEKASDEAMVELILVDFLTNLTVSLPAPTSIETTNKIKDSLDVVEDLVEKWISMAGHSGNLEQVAKLLNLDGSSDLNDPEKIKAQIKSVFLAEAFRRYNLPMPFDDIINEGKGGGLASIVNAVVAQRQNVGEFLALMIAGVSEADAQVLKDHAKKIQKALDRFQTEKDKIVQPEEADDSMTNGAPQLDEDGNPIPGDDGANAGDDASLDDGSTNSPDDTDLDADDGATPADDGTDNTDTDLDDDTGNADASTTSTDNDDDDTDTPPAADGDGTDPSKNDPDYQPFGS